MAKRSDPNPTYWDDYTAFQQVKHDLIRCYLNGWYPKLSWSGRVLYVDTHAGRGKYQTGDPGSPVVALRTLLQHSALDRLLAECEFRFRFIERDRDNLAALQVELVEQFSPLPKGIEVETTEGDAFDELSTILADLKKRGAKMAPAFLFVDPYGFKIPARLLSELMKAGRVEVFVNVMWRELDMLIQQHPAAGTSYARTLDEIFGSEEWRSEIVGGSVDDRLNQAIPLLARTIGATWWTSIRMVTGGQATRYLLLHLTNSDHGRDLMKQCSWSILPDGGFVVRRSTNPDQQFLIKPEPDLAPLREWVIEQLRGGARRWQDLHVAIRGEIWLEKHVNVIVRTLKAEGAIEVEPVPGRKFGAASNPLLKLRAGS